MGTQVPQVEKISQGLADVKTNADASVSVPDLKAQVMALSDLVDRLLKEVEILKGN